MVKKIKKVIAVIVTYNRKELLKECIENLKKQDYENCDILIIDNASTDGTYDYIKKLIDEKKVFYKNTGANLGGAGGFNFGVREAFKRKADYIWLMDDDCIVKKNSLEILVETAENKNDNFGFLASKVLWKDNSICNMNKQKKSIFKINDDYNTALVPVVISSFVSFFVKREVVEDVGLPIKDFFIWTDDWEYSRRISRKYDCFLVNESIVTHKCPTNNGSNIVHDTPDRLFRYSYAFRNEGYLYKKEGFPAILYPIFRQFYYYLTIIFTKNKGKLKKIGIVFKSTIKGYFFNPQIEYLKSKKGK